MKKNFIDKNKKIVVIFIIIFTLIAMVSFIIITNKYSKLEMNINHINISNLINKIQSKIEFNHKIAVEHSTSDETYNFLANKNPDYIYKNFREGSYTLEDLGLSYLILTDSKNNVKFSTFTRDFDSKNNSHFVAETINKLKNTNTIDKIINYKKQSYYLAKTPVYKTDYEDDSNGFLYLGSRISDDNLSNLAKGFSDLKFIDNQKTKQKIVNKKTHLKNKKNDYVIKNNVNTSEVYFYDNNSNLLFAIEAKKEMSLVNDLKDTLLIIFSCLLIIAIFAIIYISNKYNYELKKQFKKRDQAIENRTLKIKTEMKELEKENENLYDIAHTDFLTKAMTRRNFFINAQENFIYAEENDQLLSVIMIDIDNFKQFNDKYGHSIGDKVLVLFAKKIKDSITDKTIFGRLGGEEFALLIKNTKLEDAIIKAERLKKKVEEIELIIDGNILKITASFGVSDNQQCSNIDEMLQKADNLLYTAKESGRNLVRSRLNFC